MASASSASALSLLCAALTPRQPSSHNPTPLHFSFSTTNLSHAFSSLKLCSPQYQYRPSSFIPKATETEAPVALVAPPETETPLLQTESSDEASKPKREEVFAVVEVGSRQYIVFPGRYLYTQRLKGANVNDKITLNKVLLVGTKTSTYIGKPLVENAKVHAIVEEQTLDKKVIVFKYKKKKNYRRNIGHRQPITKIRITSIAGYENSPVVTLDDITPR